ncbi:MAG: Lipoprotein-anchoring transpeptidase ErfK/SrfK [Verrucomicrobia bacterium]|nr:MAG: Lipoprotein-anchoring transpeptidase ErfK/SrfK [Verrucomicrobiota bacterium]
MFSPSKALFAIATALFACAGVGPFPGGVCMASETSLLVSVADQKMVLWQDGLEVARFPISTSRFGLGDRLGSYATPLGLLQVAAKIGQSVREGTVFKQRRPTGEVLPPNAPGRDPIVTRIIWLRGLEAQNHNSYGRYIYIHGTPEEKLLGKPVSWGCIRMASKDVVKVFEAIDIGARVEILNKPMKVLLKEHAASDRLAQVFRD